MQTIQTDATKEGLSQVAAQPSTVASIKLQNVTSSAKSTTPDPKHLSENNSPFQAIDKAIRDLKARKFPEIPHIITVPTKTPFLPNFPFENLNTPFETWEVDKLQYMTLITNAKRGVAIARGDIWDEIHAPSPSESISLGSGTTTPRSERDPNKPRAKISIADYTAGKKSNGLPKKPMNSEATMADQRIKEEEIKKSVEPKHQNLNGHKSFAPTNPLPTPAPSTDSLSAIGSKPSSKSPMNIANSKRPETPSESQKSSSSSTEKKQKRHLEAQDSQPPEKRIKTAQNESEKPRNLSQASSSKTTAQPKDSEGDMKKGPVQNPTKQLDHSTAKQKPKQGNSSSQSSSTSSKSIDTMPPLLSPLPPGLSSPDSSSGQSQSQPGLTGSHAKADEPPETPAISKQSDVSHDKNDVASSKSPIPMPPLLSPTLPPNVERALARMKASSNTVGARHERSRNPETVGVARKLKALPHDKDTKRQQSDDNNSSAAKADLKHKDGSKDGSQDAPKEITKDATKDAPRDTHNKVDPAPTRKETFVVKLKYKKRRAKDIQRILAMKAVPDRKPIATTRDSNVPKPSTSAPSISTPLVSIPSVSTPLKTDEKKRSRPVESELEPSAKRIKAPPSIEISKSRGSLAPPFKSPGLAGPSSSPKGPFGTPRRGDAMKSVAMRKVDSSEGQAHTPQAPSVSTPASAEKNKVDPRHPRAMDIQAAKDAHMKYVSLGTRLKREMDAFLKTKDPNRAVPSEDEKKNGVFVGCESIIAYMVSFHSYDCSRRLERKPNNGENWVSFFQLLPFVHEKAKAYPELTILLLLLGIICGDSLERIYIDRLAAEPPSPAPEYIKFRDEIVKNSRDLHGMRKDYADLYRLFMSDYSTKLEEWPGLAFVKDPLVLSMPIEEAKMIAVGLLKEYAERNNISWEKKLDF